MSEVMDFLRMKRRRDVKYDDVGRSSTDDEYFNALGAYIKPQERGIVANAGLSVVRGATDFAGNVLSAAGSDSLSDFQRTQDTLDPLKADGFIEESVMGASRAAPTMAVGIASGGAAPAVFGINAYGQKQAELRDKGLSYGEALAPSLVYGGVSALIGRLKVGEVLGKGAGNYVSKALEGFGKKIAPKTMQKITDHVIGRMTKRAAELGLDISAEASEEAIEELGSVAGDALAEAISGQEGIVGDIGQRAWGTFKGSLGPAAFLRAGGGAVNKASDLHRGRRTAKELASDMDTARTVYYSNPEAVDKLLGSANKNGISRSSFRRFAQEMGLGKSSAVNSRLRKKIASNLAQVMEEAQAEARKSTPREDQGGLPLTETPVDSDTDSADVESGPQPLEPQEAADSLRQELAQRRQQAEAVVAGYRQRLDELEDKDAPAMKRRIGKQMDRAQKVLSEIDEQEAQAEIDERYANAQPVEMNQRRAIPARQQLEDEYESLQMRQSSGDSLSGEELDHMQRLENYLHDDRATDTIKQESVPPVQDGAADTNTEAEESSPDQDKRLFDALPQQAQALLKSINDRKNLTDAQKRAFYDRVLSGEDVEKVRGEIKALTEQASEKNRKVGLDAPRNNHPLMDDQKAWMEENYNQLRDKAAAISKNIGNPDERDVFIDQLVSEAQGELARKHPEPHGSENTLRDLLSSMTQRGKRLYNQSGRAEGSLDRNGSADDDGTAYAEQISRDDLKRRTDYRKDTRNQKEKAKDQRDLEKMDLPGEYEAAVEYARTERGMNEAEIEEAVREAETELGRDRAEFQDGDLNGFLYRRRRGSSISEPEQTVAQEGKQRKEDAQQIAENLARAFEGDITYVKGKFAGRFDPRSKAVQSATRGDIPTAIHEVFHALDSRYGVLREYMGMGTSPLDLEMDIDPSLGLKEKFRARQEAFAEFGEKYMLDPDNMRIFKPHMSRLLEKRLPPPALALLLSHSKKISAYAQLGGLEKAKLHIAGMDEAGKGFLVNLLDTLDKNKFGALVCNKIARFLTDEYAPINRMEKKFMLAKNRKLPPIERPSDLIRTLNGLPDRYMDMMSNGFVRADGTRVNMSREDILAPLMVDGQTATEFEQSTATALALGTARRVLEEADNRAKRVRQAKADLKEAEAQGNKSLIQSARKVLKNAQAATKGTIIGWGGSITDEIKIAKDVIMEVETNKSMLSKYNEFLANLREWNNLGLEYMKDTGRISEEEHKTILESHKHYIPLNRVMDDGGDPMGFIKGGVKDSQDVLKKFKGSARRVENPLISSMLNVESMIHEADRNSIMLNLVDMAHESGMYENNGFRGADFIEEVTEGTKDAIRVFRDGEAKYYVIKDKGLHDAVSAVGKQRQMPEWLRVLTMPAKVLRAGVTYSWSFIQRNVLRDFQNRWLIGNPEMSKRYGKGIDKANGMTFNELIPEGETLESLYNQSGAGLTGSTYNPRNARKDLRYQMRKMAGDKTRFMSPSSVAEAASKLLEKSEKVNRTREWRDGYMSARKAGLNHRDAMIAAAVASRNLLDYARGGVILKTLSSYVPFLNARMQGSVSTWNALKDRPLRVGSKILGYSLLTAAAETLINHLQGKDAEEEYRNLPAWRKAMFMNLHVGNGYFISIPRADAAAKLAWTTSLAFQKLGGDDNAFYDYTSTLVGESIGIFDPLQALPAKGAWEVATNRNFLFGNNIVPDWEKYKPVEKREGTERASRIGKALQAISLDSIDSRHIDQFIVSSGGSLASQLLYLSDIGREDKPRHGLDYLRKFSGAMAPMPGYDARDYNYLQDLANKVDKGSSSEMRRLRGLLRKSSETTNLKDREELRLRVIRLSQRLAKQYETLLERQ